MEKKNRRQSDLNHNPQPVVVERTGVRVGATGFVALCGADANDDPDAPKGVERLVHFTYQKPGKKSQLVSVDSFFNSWIGPGIELCDFPVDKMLESKAGIQYEIPRRFEIGTDLIRGFVAAYVRDRLGKRYRPGALPDLETMITYTDIEDVVTTAPPTRQKPPPSKVTARLRKTGTKVAASTRKRRPS